ncbi:MAG: hypothetical protein GX029_10300 [Pseudomonadaceae bacterium]|nr:hypothetical protein [Pseudomonadaceae bacterium]
MAAQSKKDLSWQFYLLQLPFWAALVLLVMVSLLVITLRFLIPKMDSARPQLETWLSEQLPFDLKTAQIAGSLFKIDPALSLEELSFSHQGQEFLVIKDVYLELDTLATLIAGAPRMKDVRIAGLELWLEETPKGWQLQGFEANNLAKTTANETNTLETPAMSLQQVLGYIEQLLVQGELNFTDLRFHFNPLDDEPLFFSANSMSYRRWSQGRQFSFQLEASTPTTQPAELVVTLEGKAFDVASSHVSAWFNFPLVSLDDFQALWPAALQQEAQNIQGHFSVEGWFNLQQGQVQLDLQARQVELIRDQLWQIEFEKADLTLQGKLDAWSADWKISELRSSHYFFNELAGRVGQQQQNSYLQLEELKLDPLAQQLIKDLNLPERVRELIKDLAPSGSLKNLLITQDEAGEFELQANLQQVGVNAWQGAPQGAGLNGWLQAKAKGGQVVFADHPLQLSFPELYSPVWNFTQAKGVVSWELAGDDLWVVGKDLAVVLPVAGVPDNPVQVSGEFAYFYGPQDQRFYLNLGLLAVDVAAHQQLVPDKLVEPALVDWLTSALQAGQVNKAGFIYAGPLGSKATFQLVTDFSATRFKFQPDWPSLNDASGYVQVMNGWVKGRVKSAKLNSGQLSEAYFATGLNEQGELMLEVASQLEAPLELFPWLVKNSPLKTQVPEALHEWRYLGQLKGALSLGVPLSAVEKLPRVELKTDISQGQLTLNQIDLTLTEINGPLNFTLEKGLESSGLLGQVMSQPVQAFFITEPENYLTFSTHLAGDDLKTYFKLPKALELSGVTPLQGSLLLAPISVLEITSDLQGLSFINPLPWQKKAAEALDFKMQLDFADEKLPLSLQFADQASFLMHLGNLEQGSHLQLAEQAVLPPVLPEAPGLVISILVNKLNVQPIYTWFKQLVEDKELSSVAVMPSNGLEGLNSFDLEVEQLSWDDFSLDKTTLNLKQLTDGLKLNFATSRAVGEVWLTNAPEQTLDIHLDHLYLPVIKQQDLNNTASKRTNYQVKQDWLNNYNPQNFPAARVKIDDLKLGNKHFGKITAQFNADQQGVKLDPLQIDLEQSHLLASLDWVKNEQGHASHLVGKVTGKNLSPALMAVTGASEPLLVSGKHQLTFVADWQGSPVAFDLKTVKSKLQLDITEGYFPKTDMSLSGVSQVFGLLNMDTLLRRLRLDFSDVTSKGVSYNSIKGQYQLENGYLTTLEPTKVISSATRMTLAGQVDLIEETLQQELTLVMPVAQSLPLAAVLAGAPQIGAAIWIVQKALSNVFDTFTEARYKVSGPINNPEVELQRIF